MRSKNIELMQGICRYVEEYYLENGKSPTTRLIAAALNIANGTAYKYIISMKNNGMIDYDGKTIQTPITKKINKEANKAPIIGSIPCGTPELKEENIEEYVSLPTAIFGKGDYFILKASGNSMVDAGINSGDLVVIRKQETAEDGDIVVALVDNENTLKRYYKDAENKCFILHPENKQLEDIIVKDLVIQGVAQQVIKNL